MKIRNDFVSNSSSSSFIITTRKSVGQLIDFIVKNAHSKRKDGSECWSDWLDDKNREFLERNLANPYISLVIGDFRIVGTPESADFEDEERHENSGRYLDFSNAVVKKDDIKKFIDGGDVRVTLEDFKSKNYNGVLKDSGYRVFEITRESVDFTRWLVSQCDSREDPKYTALCEFYKNEVPENVKTYEAEPSRELADKWKKLQDACSGMMFVPTFSKYVKMADGSWKDEIHPITELLDEYDRALKDGNRIFRICCGYSGEGTDWSSYIWIDNASFNGDAAFKFEDDCFW